MYIIMINDDQRKFLAECVRAALNSPWSDHSDVQEQNDRADAQLLFEMLDDLPNIERADPGVIHGLCL